MRFLLVLLILGTCLYVGKAQTTGLNNQPVSSPATDVPKKPENGSLSPRNLDGRPGNQGENQLANGQDPTDQGGRPNWSGRPPWSPNNGRQNLHGNYWHKQNRGGRWGVQNGQDRLGGGLLVQNDGQDDSQGSGRWPLGGWQNGNRGGGRWSPNGGQYGSQGGGRWSPNELQNGQGRIGGGRWPPRGPGGGRWLSPYDAQGGPGESELGRWRQGQNNQNEQLDR